MQEHTWYQYRPSPVQVRTWEEANDWINGGRNKLSHRRLSKQRCLRRARAMSYGATKHPDDIVLQLYETDIVIYHRDGTFTIRHDGHTTKTTIWDLQNHTPVQLRGVPGSALPGDGFWCSEFEVVHRTDQRTLPKIQKCRVCHGTTIVVTTCDAGRCARPYRWQGRDGILSWPDKEWTELPGHQWTTNYLPSEHDIRWGVSPRSGAVKWWNMPHEYVAVGADTVLTRNHERPRRDLGMQACWHGYLEPHLLYNECTNCYGAGTRDYGSKPIHVAFGRRDVLHITATGRVIRPIETWAEQIAALRQIRQRMRS